MSVVVDSYSFVVGVTRMDDDDPWLLVPIFSWSAEKRVPPTPDVNDVICRLLMSAFS